MKASEEFIMNRYDLNSEQLSDWRDQMKKLKGFDFDNIPDLMVAFAKLHVEAALKVASKLDFEDITHPEANDYEEAVEMTILECYPLDNIK